MSPEEYAWKFKHLPVMLFDGMVKEVGINKYLKTKQAWIDLESSSGRQKAAVTEYFRVYAAIAKELKKKPPKTFLLDGWPFEVAGIQRAYSGKGCPAEILDALWLASRFKMVDGNSLQKYCDSFLGLDCNGYAGNYIGEHMPVGSYDQHPRKDPTKIATGDVVVFYEGPRNPNGKHVGVIGEITSLVSKTLTFSFVDSGGPEEGVKIVTHAEELIKDEDGSLYYQGRRRGYISQGPPKKGHRPWARFRAPGLLGEAIQVTRDFLKDAFEPVEVHHH